EKSSASSCGMLITSKVVIPGRARARTMGRACAPENLEIPRCAIAHLRSGPSDHPGMTESVSGHLREQLVDILPVHQMIDKRLQIIRAAIAIIDVIGMLPDVDAEDRRGAMHQRVFAVGGLGDFELAVLHRQPRPARTELANTGGGEIG